MPNINAVDLMIVMALVLVIGYVIYYIRKEKKKGARCIGCPSSGTCGKKECTCNTEKNE